MVNLRGLQEKYTMGIDYMQSGYLPTPQFSRTLRNYRRSFCFRLCQSPLCQGLPRPRRFPGGLHKRCLKPHTVPAVRRALPYGKPVAGFGVRRQFYLQKYFYRMFVENKRAAGGTFVISVKLFSLPPAVVLCRLYTNSPAWILPIRILNGLPSPK